MVICLGVGGGGGSEINNLWSSGLGRGGHIILGIWDSEFSLHNKNVSSLCVCVAGGGGGGRPLHIHFQFLFFQT